MLNGEQVTTRGPATFSIKLNVQTNVYVVDSANWSNLRNGRPFHYVDGGHATHSPILVRVPRAGTWWIVIEGIPGRRVNYEIAVAA